MSSLALLKIFFIISMSQVGKRSRGSSSPVSYQPTLCITLTMALGVNCFIFLTCCEIKNALSCSCNVNWDKLLTMSIT